MQIGVYRPGRDASIHRYAERAHRNDGSANSSESPDWRAQWKGNTFCICYFLCPMNLLPCWWAYLFTKTSTQTRLLKHPHTHIDIYMYIILHWLPREWSLLTSLYQMAALKSWKRLSTPKPTSAYRKTTERQLIRNTQFLHPLNGMQCVNTCVVAC